MICAVSKHTCYSEWELANLVLRLHRNCAELCLTIYAAAQNPFPSRNYSVYYMYFLRYGFVQARSDSDREYFGADPVFPGRACGGIMSRSSGSLVVPLILVLVITMLLYFHWGLRGQVTRVHEEASQISDKLNTVRQERDELAAQVQRYTEQVNQATHEKRDLNDQKRSLSAKLDEAQVNLVRVYALA